MTNQQHDTNTIPEPTITEEMKRFIVTRHAQGLSTAAAVDELLQKFEELQTYIQHPEVDAAAYRKKWIRGFSTYRITHPKFPKKYIPVWEAAQESVEPDVRAMVMHLQERIERFEAQQLEINRLISNTIQALWTGNAALDTIETLQRAIQAAKKGDAGSPN